MAVAHYAISHATMFKVLAITSFEEKSLADKPAWEQFRKDLIGDKLVVGLGAQPISIDGAMVAVDKLDVGSDPRSYYDNPYSYELAPDQGTPPSPGEGKVQKLRSVGTTISATLSNAGVLTITLSAPPDPLIANVLVLFEGLAPVSSTINGAGNNVTTTVSVGTVTAGQFYAVIVMAQGAATLATRVKAA